MNIVILILAGISCVPYYLKYEKRRPQTRENVVISVMIALTVTSRMIFAIMPGFKPVTAMVIICGMVFGREAGFLCGSFSAFISNFFFGQGPWTPFQMIAWGVIGWLSGVLNDRNRLERYRTMQMLFGIFAGIFFSVFMDIWTVLAAGENFQWMRYLAVLGTSFSVTVEYCVSNVIFLWVMTPVLLKKLNRVKYKYGFYKESEIQNGSIN